MVDGVKRASLGKPDSRLPITRELLGRILPSVCKSRYESHLLRAAFSNVNLTMITLILTYFEVK